jgi:hypothetical protein
MMAVSCDEGSNHVRLFLQRVVDLADPDGNATNPGFDELPEELSFDTDSSDQPDNETVPRTEPEAETNNQLLGLDLNGDYGFEELIEASRHIESTVFSNPVISICIKFQYEFSKLKCNLVQSQYFVTNTDSTSDFWLENERKFPFLFKLALILMSISASSAFIERLLY